MQLEDYVSPSPHWGSWHLAASACAIYNVKHGYAEFGLVDLSTTRVLADRVVHFLEKSWCRGRDAEDLLRAIHAIIGLHVDVTREPYTSPLPRAKRGLPVLRVTFTDAGSMPILVSLYSRLRRMLAPTTNEAL